MILLCGLLLAACNPRGMPGTALPPPNMMTIAQKAPPAPMPETVPPPPTATPAKHFAWDPGHWQWTGQGYVWIAGRYVESPSQGAAWVPGSWTYNGSSNWVWTPGHWS